MNEQLLLPYQSAWIADKSQVKIWEKSRRIGASYAEAFDSVLEAAASLEAGGKSTYYLSYNKEMTQQFIKDCAFWAKLVNAACSDVEEIVLRDENKDITVYRIRFASGFEIWALPSKPHSLRSKQGRVIIDEAAFVDDLSELLKASMALLMWGGVVRILSTHNGDENPFNELIKDVLASKFKYSLHRTTFDQALAQGLYKKICQTANPRRQWSQEAEDLWRQEIIDFYGEGADEELFCIPSRSGGAYLTSSLIEACMKAEIPLITWTPPAADFVDWPLAKSEAETSHWLKEQLYPFLQDLPRDCAHFLGGDFGRSADLSSFWPGTEMPDLSIHTPFLLELRDCPHRTQEQILFYIIDNLPRFSGAALDARGNGSALAEAARQRYGPEQVLEVMISESWYRNTMPLLKSGLEDKTITLPGHANVLSDLRSLRVVKGVARLPEKRVKDATGQRHGDSAIALAMLLHAKKELGSFEPWQCETAKAGEEIAGFDWHGFF